jgi:hypothetical protein
MRWFLQRLAFLLVAVALLAGLAWWFVTSRTIDLVGILQPRVPAPQDLSDWEIDLRMSDESIRYLHRALGPARGSNELEVRILVTSHPTRVFKGKLHRDTIELANARAKVRIHPVNDDIPAEDCVPNELLLPGVEAHTRVDCR